MEYLDGAEYVVDSVSRDGEHRICAIWEYDKRNANGTNFVYFGMELRPAISKVCRRREGSIRVSHSHPQNGPSSTQRAVVTRARSGHCR